MIDLQTWFRDEAIDKFYKLLIYKKVWTPYELDKKFSDESQYEDGGYYKTVKILELIELPDKDILFKFQEYIEVAEYLEEDKNEYTFKFREIGTPFFERLSNIKLLEKEIDE